MKYHLSRICKDCGKELFYSCITSYRNSLKQNTICKRCSNIMKSNKNSNLNILLNESYETYYWIGFILADGHISKNNRLKVSLSILDIEHLKKLAFYLKTDIILIKKGQQCMLSCMDSIVLEKVINKFDIKSNKTYNPPNINIFKKLEKYKLLALFVGFIDGDGSIRNLHKRKDFNLNIKCHSSWYEILSYFEETFFNTHFCKINNQGYSHFMCGNSIKLKELKRKVLLLNLPIMERKWDVIDLNFISRYDSSDEMKYKLFDLIKKGKKRKEISKELKITQSWISMIIKKYKKDYLL